MVREQFRTLRGTLVETYHKIQTLFKRDLDGSITGQKGKMIEGAWTTPELEYLAGNEWEFTEKVDGTNIRIGWNYQDYEVEFAGRSDNAVIPTPLLDYLEDAFTPYLFEKAGLNDGKIILFGEGYGPKIQGGGKYRGDHSFVLFDVKIANWWLHRKDVDDIAGKLGIDSVPTIGYGTLNDAISMVRSGIRISGLEWARYDGGSVHGGLKSTWGDFEAEGIVARPKIPMFDRKGQRIITKIKAVDFK